MIRTVYNALAEIFAGDSPTIDLRLEGIDPDMSFEQFLGWLRLGAAVEGSQKEAP